MTMIVITKNFQMVTTFTNVVRDSSIRRLKIIFEIVNKTKALAKIINKIGL